MNVKSERFAKTLEENEIKCFNIEEIKDELNTVLFRSTMEIEGQRLPMVVVIDDSIYVIVRVLIAGKCITGDNKEKVTALLNQLNANYKSFKLYTTEPGEIVMDTCVPSTAEQFEPDMVRALIDLNIKCLEEGTYRSLMQLVWGNTAPEKAAAQSTGKQKQKA